jgi:FlaA1/EpsC-like NDP-sugar epimerase
MWRYVSLSDVVHIVASYSSVTSVLLFMRLGLGERWALLRIPLSIIAIEFSLSLFGALGVRALRRMMYQGSLTFERSGQGRKAVLLVGAGAAGLMTARELSRRSDRRIAGFLDDDPKKRGALINGIPVLGRLEELPQVARNHRIEEIVLCLTRAPRNVLKQMWQHCDGLGARTLIIPTLDEIVDGDVRVSRLREVSMEELLGREAVELYSDKAKLGAFYAGKRILITGAGGSIGAELARQLCSFDVESLVLLDKDEHSLYELELQLSVRSQAPPYQIVLGDIRSVSRVQRVFHEFRPQIVFHAAAYKHVPLMERNPSEAIINNVFGTKSLVEQAIGAQTETFLLISTDKAVRPSSVMGASKRLAELLVQRHTRGKGQTRLGCVRFGNVMSSRGSVIPLFQRQIAAGDPITLTDPEVRRFMMTIPEAIQLVIQAAQEVDGGEIFVLNMGDQVRIADLARDLIELHGFRPGEDIRIETIGLRPGEKLCEELVGEDESLEATDHPMLYRVVGPSRIDEGQLDSLLATLWNAAIHHDRCEVLRLLSHAQVLHPLGASK